MISIRRQLAEIRNGSILLRVAIHNTLISWCTALGSNCTALPGEIVGVGTDVHLAGFQFGGAPFASWRASFTMETFPVSVNISGAT